MDQPMSHPDVQRLRDNPEAVCELMNEAFATKSYETILNAIYQSLIAQNVSAIAREAGLRRDKLYKSLGGKVDPKFSRVIKLLTALNIQLVARPTSFQSQVIHPKLGRPIKNPSPVAPPRRKPNRMARKS
jgi:probable addiction module antidote protein